MALSFRPSGGIDRSAFRAEPAPFRFLPRKGIPRFNCRRPGGHAVALSVASGRTASNRTLQTVRVTLPLHDCLPKAENGNWTKS